MGRNKKKEYKAVIVDRVALDWLALSTYSEWAYREWYAIVEKIGVSLPATTGFKQYKGVEWDEGISIVEGVQAKGPHYMFTAMGAIADTAMRYIREWSTLEIESLKCVRVDVQITLAPVPERRELIDLAREVNSGSLGEWSGRGRPNVEAQYSEDGQTLYIGSRYSDTFVRIYDKKIKEVGRGEWMAERYEVEYKESRAQSLFTRIMNTPPDRLDRPMREAIKANLERLPPGLAVQVRAANLGDNDVGALAPRHVPRGKHKRSTWVASIGDALSLAAQMAGPEGEENRRVLLEAFIRGVKGNGGIDTDGCFVVMPGGEIYSSRGIKYNGGTGDGTVTLSDIKNSTIHIGTITGRDSVSHSQGFQKPPGPPGEKEE